MPHYWPYVAFGCGFCLGPNIWTLSHSNTVTKFITWITRLQCQRARVTMMWGLHRKWWLSEVMMYEQQEEWHKRKNSRIGENLINVALLGDTIRWKPLLSRWSRSHCIKCSCSMKRSCLNYSEYSPGLPISYLHKFYFLYIFLSLSSESTPPRVIKHVDA